MMIALMIDRIQETFDSILSYMRGRSVPRKVLSSKFIKRIKTKSSYHCARKQFSRKIRQPKPIVSRQKANKASDFRQILPPVVDSDLVKYKTKIDNETHGTILFVISCFGADAINSCD